MHPNLEKLLTPEKKARLAEIAKAHRVARLYAFGSVCSDRFREESDVDVLYLFEEIDLGEKAWHFFRLADELEDLFGRKVDLVSEKHLKNKYLIQSIEQEKTLLYAA